jgi:hypothetical protein
MAVAKKVQGVWIVIPTIITAMSLVLIVFASQVGNASRFQPDSVRTFGVALFLIGGFLLIVLGVSAQ